MRRRYPHIRFARHWEITPTAHYQLGQCQAMVSAMCEIPLEPEIYSSLKLVSLIKGAQATTAIEGNTLTEEEIGRVQRGESLAPSKQYQELEVRNILRAMDDLLEQVAVRGDRPLITPELIRSLHTAIGRDLGEHFDAVPGHYRTDERFVGPYKCPRAEDVERLVSLLCEWLQEEFGFASHRQSFTDAVAQAIVTHVYLEWIHPFGDGNGRTGRLLEFYVLLRTGNPDIASHVLSNFYNETRPEYYRQLQRAHASRDLSSFISYAVTGLRDGLQHTLEMVQRNQFDTAWRSHIYDRFAEKRYRKTVFKRRRNLILNMPHDAIYRLEDIPRINAEIALTYGGLSLRTVRRDLHELMAMNLIRIEGTGFKANTDVLRKHMAVRLRT